MPASFLDVRRGRPIDIQVIIIRSKQTLKHFSCAVLKFGDFRDKILANLTLVNSIFQKGKRLPKKSLPIAKLKKKKNSPRENPSFSLKTKKIDSTCLKYIKHRTVEYSLVQSS